jgi:hypothetical protein
MFFFPLPMGIQRITVPCCEECRKEYERDEAPTRNFLISSAKAESLWPRENQIEAKRNRALEGDRTQFMDMNNAMRIAEVFAESGIFLGTAPAFDLSQPFLNRFFARMARALLHEEFRAGFVECDVDWRPLANEGAKKEFLKRARRSRSIGDTFSYAAHMKRGSRVWYWLLNFIGNDFLVKQTLKEPLSDRVLER